MSVDISVAIIFKNEMRSLERCLKSLQPLRERVNAEVVMADTGSADGSHTVAERYADIVFDFPWINDFAAARNAVLGRCSGKWILTLDCDEWLDCDLDELTEFVRSKGSEQYDGAYVLLRNYSTANLDRYMDILLPRLMRMGARPRYEGAIHEVPAFAAGNGKTTRLCKTILHHDGYVMLNDGSEAGRLKRARNTALLRAELNRAPDDLQRLMQYLESAEGTEDYLSTLRHAVALVEKREGNWQRFGPPILRRAVFDAYNGGLPELNDWTEKACSMFPESYYTRIDVAFIQLVRALTEGDCEKVIVIGENFLKAQADFCNDLDAYAKASVSFLQRNDDYWAQYVRLRLAEAYLESKQLNRAAELLGQTDWVQLDARHTRYFLEMLGRLETAGYDVSGLLEACRTGLDERPDDRAEECRAILREVTAPPELLQLAAKVKAILERLPQDDPVVISLKSSDAYKKVAYLIKE